MDDEDYCSCCGPECSMCFAIEGDPEEEGEIVDEVEENT
jgi:hypothetical protein